VAAQNIFPKKIINVHGNQFLEQMNKLAHCLASRGFLKNPGAKIVLRR
jgi:hypothetical protein